MKKYIFFLFLLTPMALHHQNVIKQSNAENEVKDVIINTVEISEPKLNEFHDLSRQVSHNDDLDDLMKRMNNIIDRDQLIRKLNNNTATEEERNLFGQYLQIKAESYQAIIDLELNKLEQDYL